LRTVSYPGLPSFEILLLSKEVCRLYSNCSSHFSDCVFAEAYLLQAEEKFCERDFEAAEALYDAAIQSSKQHKFLNEEALANELAGHFYRDTGRRNRSIPYFQQAVEKYSEWGAVAKARSLEMFLDDTVKSSMEIL
jgi:tetratricopeptide (TPR) repeat protein